MKLLREVYRKEDMDLTGKRISREAVRGIIASGRRLLMIYSPQNGDYKFPGGGIGAGETFEDALIREIREEAGAEVTEITGEFGCVVEYDIPAEADYDVFAMTSNYYFCRISDNLGEQQLDQYEADLGFRPEWVDVDVAIRTNRSILEEENRPTPRWTARETFVLEEIRRLLEEGQRW